MKDTLKSKLDYLNSLNDSHLNKAQKLMEAGGSKIHVLDMLAIPIYNRSMALIDGFITLIDNNFICAAPIIRMQLDNFLRFYASTLVDDISEFVLRVMDGERISSFKDFNTGKKLSDAYLVKKVTVKVPWIPKLYQETSGYIHFSSKHIYNSAHSDKKDSMIIKMKVGKEDSIIPLELKIEAVDAMIEITKLLLDSLGRWSVHKDETFG